MLQAGASRRLELREALSSGCRGCGEVVVADLDDLLRHPGEEVPERGGRWLQEIKAGRIGLVVACPPAGSFSRLRYANKLGPAAVRSKKFPGGYPWLSGANRQRCQREIAVIALCCALCAVATISCGQRFALLHPE